MKRPLTAATVITIVLLLAFPAAADQIVNGDFSQAVNFNDTSGWESSDDFGAPQPSGHVSIVDHAAQLSTAGIASGPSLITLYQWLDIPQWAETLSFDLAFENTEEDTQPASDNHFPDYLEVSYMDDSDLNYDRYFIGLDTNGPYDPITFDAINELPDSDGWYSFVFDIGDITGRQGTLYFDLSDQDDGWYSVARVDNVRFNAAPVPEPTTLVLSGLGLLLAGASLRRTRRKQARQSGTSSQNAPEPI